MMKYILTLCSIMLFSTIGTQIFAQEDSKHEYHYKQLDPIETDEYKIEIADAHSQAEFTVMKAKITNKTSDFLIFKQSEILFKYEHGDVKHEGKDIIIKPGGSVSKSIKVTGGLQFHVEKLSVIYDCFYRLSAEKELVKAPDFDIPGSINEFKAGGFQVTMKKLDKRTQETVANFNVIYTGNDYGIVTSGKTAARLDDGREFASTAGKKIKLNVLAPGEKKKLTVSYTIPGKTADMQLVNMKIIWRTTFVESKAIKLAAQTLNFTVN
ncbi:MAG TPA: hypothetical protein EYN38_04855 [Flavobacteriales bacterium]|nr:hypothetical protein [Flavobacteriales bacterium]HIA13128.1 hypothetical protein [Flavobacteriales bacterium]HIO72419.1 hypothetical protein [Flavobacteriales bacterium]